MISFRLSEEEYASLLQLCEHEGSRSVSDLAREAVQRMFLEGQQHPVHATLKELENRINGLDLELQRLAFASTHSEAE
jgi:hypothetical protein